MHTDALENGSERMPRMTFSACVKSFGTAPQKMLHSRPLEAGQSVWEASGTQQAPLGVFDRKKLGETCLNNAQDVSAWQKPDN